MPPAGANPSIFLWELELERGRQHSGERSERSDEREFWLEIADKLVIRGHQFSAFLLRKGDVQGVVYADAFGR